MKKTKHNSSKFPTQKTSVVQTIFFRIVRKVQESQQTLNLSSLTSVAPGEQKQVLGERLFPMIQRIQPDLAGKITGMLLEIDASEIINMMDSEDALKAKVDEALSVLHAHQTQQTVDVKK